MEPVRIAHISDLHFGAKGQNKIWNLLKQHLQTQLKPDLVLVTGDIVDTPDLALFLDAKSELDSLCAGIHGKPAPVAYFVCAGNHDRYPYGNKSTILELTRRLRHPLSGGDFKLWFEKIFGSIVPPIKQPQNISLGPARNSWEIRLFAIESSLDADKSARGHVTLDTLNLLATCMDSTNSVQAPSSNPGMTTDRGQGPGGPDLGIALVHHHLLSVRLLEEARQGRSSDLLQLTTLVNSGSLAEALASNHVDLVLHGHEHASNSALYGTVEKGGGVTAIVGAASATGVMTGKECAAERASYNVLELHANRSIKMNVNRWEAGGWRSHEVDLLDAQSVRRSRFLRRSGDRLQRKPISEIVKYIEFTRERDGLIREYRTNWVANENRWTLSVQNTTGYPTDLDVRFIGPRGTAWKPHEDMDFKYSRDDEPGSYHFQCRLDDDIASEPQRIDISYRWLDGALLTESELEALEPERKDVIRDLGYEYAAIVPRMLLNSLRLIVKLPSEFAPEQVHVFLRDVSTKNNGLLQQSDITDCLRIVSRGLYSLTVPFPRPDFQYIIAWPPPKATSQVKEALTFEQVSSRKGDILVKTFHDALQGTPFGQFAPGVQVSLYIPTNASKRNVLRRVGMYPQDSTPHPKKEIHAGKEDPIISRAWWGGLPIRPQTDSDDSAEELAKLGFLPGEVALIALPIRFDITGGTLQPWGVLRLGLRGGLDEVRRLLVPEKAIELRTMFLTPMIRLLAESEIGQM